MPDDFGGPPGSAPNPPTDPSGIPPTGIYQDPSTGTIYVNGVPIGGTGGDPTGTDSGGGAPLGGSPNTPGSTPATPSVNDPSFWSKVGNFITSKNLPALLQFILGAYGALSPKGFLTPPLTPEQKALQDYLMGQLKSSTDEHNAFGSALDAYAHQGANVPLPMAPDKYGYNPYPNGAPTYDISKAIDALVNQPNGTGTGGPPPQTPPTTPVTPGTRPNAPEMPRNNVPPMNQPPGIYSPWLPNGKPPNAGNIGPGTNRSGTLPAPTPPVPAVPPAQGVPSSPQTGSGNQTLTPMVAQKFRDFVAKNGNGAGHAVANLLDQYPELGVDGAIAVLGG